MSISRRKVLAGLGGIVATAALPHAPAVASELAMPTLEEAFGEPRMAWLNGLFRARYLPLISDAVEEAIFDRLGHFRASPKFRAGMTRFLYDGKPVQILIHFDNPSLTLPSGRTADQFSVDCMISFVLRKAKVLPPTTGHTFTEFRADSDSVWWRWWQGDDWQKVGWEAPPKKRNRRSPGYQWPEPPV
ncbi:hypothetical protein [Rhodopseudomonas pseudopalustris]|uniref:Tat (Twin-arginine translocation) pathway signal sequence n=1 Tax=Rhodopseudomonas pseudopalustris TaxID=1513892 RepID=A0A1H8SP28_9BRAD|nr:hypothetical protein [Rhodopseudomonas pseudopalustris]SEO80530.1 hypothetical protein SAMN05444123_1059 [Rhodopseudomonas pseudopalustris]